MDHIAVLGTAIPEVLLPTIKTYQELLAANADAILSTPRETHNYGPHPRQMLDLYSPRPGSADNAPPILLFFYGGGFASGDKVLSESQGIVYTNLGYLFSQKLSLLTIIVDYRRIREGAKFPSGGEDVAAAVRWLKSNCGASNGDRDAFLIGNSAGGVHVVTFMLEPKFAALRASISPDSVSGVSLRGSILLSAPFDFTNIAKSRVKTLEAYYGDRARADCPLGLLQRFKAPEETLPKILVLWGALDPEDEIVQPNLNFIQEWKSHKDLDPRAIYEVVLEGHNHISPPLALGTNLQREEEWGFLVGKWICGARRSSRL